jgi:hypothetical protein
MREKQMSSVNWMPGMTLEQIEKLVILEALKFYRGNKSQTALTLGITVKTIDNKLERYTEDAKREADRIERDRIERDRQLAHQRGVKITEHYREGSSHQVAQTPRPETSRNETPSGFHMEPAVKTSEEHAVSVPERKEVQAVSSKFASTGSHGRRR